MPSANFTATLTRRISVGLRSATVTVRGSASALPSAVAVAPAGRSSSSVAGGGHPGRGVLRRRRRRAARRRHGQKNRVQTTRSPYGTRREHGGSTDLHWICGSACPQVGVEYREASGLARRPTPRQTCASPRLCTYSSPSSTPVLSPSFGDLRAEAVEHRQPEVVERRLGLVADVAAGLDRAAALAGQQDRQVVVGVAVAVGDGAAVGDHAVVEQRAVALR